MSDYRPCLKPVGIALIVVGVLDIGWMIWCVAHEQAYSSSFNIFAVIAGILLLRGGLRTANTVAYFSALMLSAFTGLIVVLPLLMPVDLLLAHLRLDPVSFGVGILFVVCVQVFLGWVYKRLTAPSILAAIAEKHPRCTKFWRRPQAGFIVGILLVVILGVSLRFMMRGATAERAIAKAKQKVGEDYRFNVSHLSMSSSGGKTHVEAVVTAYNQKEIHDVAVAWDQ